MRILLTVLILTCLVVLWTNHTFYMPRMGDCLAPNVHDKFLTRAECARVIRRARALGLRRSVVTEASDAAGSVDETRTSTQVFLPRDDPVSRWLMEKVGTFLRVPPQNMELVQVLHYGPGQQYEPHFDGCDDGCDGGKNLPRVATFFIYLNDVDEGGETVFPTLGTSVSPKAGRACHWYNIDAATGADLPCALHGGSPVVRGEKWACNVWIR